MLVLLIRKVPLTLILFFTSILLYSQPLPKVTIHIVSESNIPSLDANEFEDVVREEILTLLNNRFEVDMQATYCNYDIKVLNETFEAIFADPEVDIIVAIGAMSSGILATQKNYSKPAIAGIILDNELQKIPLTDEGTSGVPNFTYLQSPFNIQRDLIKLKEIYPYRHLAFMGADELIDELSFVRDFIGNIAQGLGAESHYVPAKGTAEEIFLSIPEEIDAIYFFPIFNDAEMEIFPELMEKINQSGIATAALLGEEYVEQGVLMGYEAGKNLQSMPRRIAINILKILEGTPAADLPVAIPTYNETLLINAATANVSNIHPNFDIISEAIVVNFGEENTGTRHTLQGVLAEGLKQNLDILISQRDPILAQKDMQLARANYLPQVEGNATYSILDKRTAENSFGQQGRYTLSVGGTVSQIIFSEPAIANIQSQKLLQKGQEEGFRQVQLDVILDLATAYLNLLQANTLVEINIENVQVTKENYDIAQAKEAVGYTGATDINRWTSELAQRNIELRRAQAQFKQAQFQLNQLLNRPIDEAFNVEDITLQQQMLYVTDQRILSLIQNYRDLKRFSDFLVEEAINNLPELKQINFSLAAQERLRKSLSRRFYLPSIALNGSLTDVVNRWEVSENPQFPSPIDQPTWNIGIGLQYPIFQGGTRNLDLQRTKIAIDQLGDQRMNLRRQLDVRVRASLENASATFVEVELSRKAADAAKKNFDIVQDSYSQGIVNVTNLIDAQNVAIATALSAQNAIYQFVIDFLNVERSIGNYYFLSSEGERDAFFEKLIIYMNTSK